MRRFGSRPRSALANSAAASDQRCCEPRRAASTRSARARCDGAQALAAGLGEGVRGDCAAIEGGRHLGEDEPILRAARLRRDRDDPVALAARGPSRQRRRGNGGEGVAQGQVEQHLLAVVGVHEHELRRRLADGGDGAFALAHRDGALGIGQFDHALEHDERGRGCRRPRATSRCRGWPRPRPAS